MPCIEGEREKNYERARFLIHDLDKIEDPQFIVLPELFAVGFRHTDYLSEREGIAQETIDFLQELAKDKESYVVTTEIEPVDDMFYNTLVMMNPDGKVVGTYRKIHPFQAEKDVFKGGSELILFDLNSIKVGVQICYDLRFPEGSRQLAEKGAELLIFPAAWPDPRAHHWNTLLLARSIENQVYVAACNRVRTGFDGKTYMGHSQLIDPWGLRLTRINSEERIVVKTGDTEMIETIRDEITCWQDRSKAGYDNVRVITE